MGAQPKCYQGATDRPFRQAFPVCLLSPGTSAPGAFPGASPSPSNPAATNAASVQVSVPRLAQLDWVPTYWLSFEVLCIFKYSSL